MANYNRTIYTAAVSTAMAAFVSGCGPAADEPSSHQKPGYPAAPTQRLAHGDRERANVADQPIVNLPARLWVARTAERSGVPERILSAYAGASLRMSAVRPDCGIGWNTLAGIGAVESVHGTFGGAYIGSDGTVRPPITGVSLDGSAGVMAIHDTDRGTLDGDDEWDRAVGPMQFIPTTWQRYAQDGNGDGMANPHQVDDALLTAATYLCERGDNLTTDDGWNAAIAAYNQSRAYALDVADHATEYASSQTTPA